MITQKEIDRINELARKKKTAGLTKAETEEQRILREKFLADFRERFKKQLESIEFVDPDDPRLKKQNIKH